MEKEITEREALTQLNILNSYGVPKEKHNKIEEYLKVLEKAIEFNEVIYKHMAYNKKDGLYIAVKDFKQGELEILEDKLLPF